MILRTMIFAYIRSQIHATGRPVYKSLKPCDFFNFSFPSRFGLPAYIIAILTPNKSGRNDHNKIIPLNFNKPVCNTKPLNLFLFVALGSYNFVQTTDAHCQQV